MTQLSISTITPLKVGLRFHAFMLLNATIVAIGKGEYVELVQTNGITIKARLSVTAARQLGHQSKVWRVSLHFRTDQQGNLIEPIFLQRIRPHQAEQDSSTIWSVAGEITFLEPRQRIMTIKIYPEREERKPFFVSVCLDLEQYELAKSATCIQASGDLLEKKLIAKKLEVIDLKIPSNWQQQNQRRLVKRLRNNHSS